MHSTLQVWPLDKLHFLVCVITKAFATCHYDLEYK